MPLRPAVSRPVLSLPPDSRPIVLHGRSNASVLSNLSSIGRPWAAGAPAPTSADIHALAALAVAVRPRDAGAALSEVDGQSGARLVDAVVTVCAVDSNDTWRAALPTAAEWLQSGTRLLWNGGTTKPFLCAFSSRWTPIDAGSAVLLNQPGTHRLCAASAGVRYFNRSLAEESQLPRAQAEFFLRSSQLGSVVGLSATIRASEAECVTVTVHAPALQVTMPANPGHSAQDATSGVPRWMEPRAHCSVDPRYSAGAAASLITLGNPAAFFLIPGCLLPLPASNVPSSVGSEAEAHLSFPTRFGPVTAAWRVTAHVLPLMAELDSTVGVRPRLVVLFLTGTLPFGPAHAVQELVSATAVDVTGAGEWLVHLRHPQPLGCEADGSLARCSSCGAAPTPSSLPQSAGPSEAVQVGSCPSGPGLAAAATRRAAPPSVGPSLRCCAVNH